LWLHSLKVAQLLRNAVCLHTNQSRSYLNHLVYILSDSQQTIKALNNFCINSRLVWDCPQFLMKLAERNMVQLVWVPGRMEIVGNEIADQLTRVGSSHPLIGPETALGVSAKVARVVMSAGSPCIDRDRLRAFLQKL